MSSSKFGQNSHKSIRTAGYSVEEDRVLCQVYLDISQDPIIGTNQSRDQFWSRIETHYHQVLPAHINNVRPVRSLQNRMQTIQTAVGKLRGCVRQIENLNPSGASEQDILNQAKVLLAQDPNFKKGFRFDHVWPLLKDLEKYADNSSTQTPTNRKRTNCNDGTQSDSNRSDKSIGSSSFCINLNADFESEDQFNNDAERPTGRKKEKMKKKHDEEMKQYFKTMIQENQEIKGMFQQSNTCLQQNQSLLEKNYELQLIRAQNETKKLELRERREDNKILQKDVESIKDLVLREALRNEQIRIYEKRARDQQSQGVGSSSVFDQYFANLGGDGDDLPNF